MTLVTQNIPHRAVYDPLWGANWKYDAPGNETPVVPRQRPKRKLNSLTAGMRSSVRGLITIALVPYLRLSLLAGHAC
jgi:hypothetical protein